MALADQFQSVGASVFKSQEEEIIIAKQPVLAEYGNEVRSVISKLPPEVSHNLLKEYCEPAPQLLEQLETAIISRELAIENAAQETNLDQKWLQSANARHMDEKGLSADDDWNAST